MLPPNVRFSPVASAVVMLFIQAELGAVWVRYTILLFAV